ncbi:membrane-bound alpha-1,6- mannosyltransferase Initiation-specific [Ascosphaera aggregata]|nr:membrane-bound alpha-1,6- mannosyltransferase Initiation-specific [Ascosphaera aggregata]
MEGDQDAAYDSVPSIAPKSLSGPASEVTSPSAGPHGIGKDKLSKKDLQVLSSKGTSQSLSSAGMQKLAPQSLRQRLQDIFKYDSHNKFPAYIWQTWKVTPASESFGEENRWREATWTEHHPDFVHHVIDDATALPLLKHLYTAFPEVLEAYMSLPSSMPVMRADFFRYLILLARGGIYSDIDTYVIQPISRWIPAEWDTSKIGLVVGIEADAAGREDWHMWYSRAVQFCQWTILSKRGHPVLRDVVANITEEILAMKQRQADTLTEVDNDEDSAAVEELRPENIDKSVVELTGPAVWTDSIYRHINSDDVWGVNNADRPTLEAKDFTGLRAQKRVGDVVVLPITSFSPGVGQMGAEDENDIMAFVKHDFDGTWKPEDEQMKSTNPPSAPAGPGNVDGDAIPTEDGRDRPSAPEVVMAPEAGN